MAGSTITAILLLAATQAVMCSVVSLEPRNFFPDVKGNLTKIVWAHAVNSKAELETALSSGDIMMLEADVVLGKLNETDNSNFTEIPIMAHPPARESDLSLEEFLNTTIQNNGTKKGIKLDFKTIQAFEKSKPILAKLRVNIKFPVFINADILPGPVNATATPVNAKDFLKGVGTIPECTLSVGWTTRYGKEYNITEGRYTAEQIKNMTGTLAENQIIQSVTYPVRAGLAANDIETVKALLKNTTSNDVTLTIWSSEGDYVDAAQLSKLIEDVGVDKVYLDVPEDLKKKLNFSSAATPASATMLVVGMVLALLSVNML